MFQSLEAKEIEKLLPDLLDPGKQKGDVIFHGHLGKLMPC